MPPLTCLLTTATVWPLVTMTALASPALEYEVLAMLKDDSIGDPAADILPGMEKTGDSELDWEWREFERPSIGDDGVMVFRAVGSTSFREGIWAGVPGDFELIGRVGFATSPGSDRRFDAIRDPSFDAGYVSFLASSSDQAGSNGEIWSGPLGQPPRRLVASGESAPGGGIFNGFYPPSAQADGSVVFVAETDAPAGASSDFGIYRASAESGVQALLRANSPTPGFPDGGLIGNSTALISHPVGGIAFRSHSLRSEPTIYHVPDPAAPIPHRFCHSYQLETARNLAGSWEERGDPVVGDGKPLRFEFPTDLEDDARFFRVRISPIEYLPSIQ